MSIVKAGNVNFHQFLDGSLIDVLFSSLAINKVHL